MARLILILGGVRSGKSRFAQQLAERVGGRNVLFIATAGAGDAEMARRIEIHRDSRPAAWPTLELPLNVGAGLAATPHRHEVVVIDCLTLLVSNLLLRDGDSPQAEAAQQRVAAEIESLLAAIRGREGTVILVSGEVGQGVVPESALGRLFRDLLGWANQSAAKQSDETYLMVAGLPVEVRTLATSVAQAAEKCASSHRAVDL